jgi:hypothetical protein
LQESRPVNLFRRTGSNQFTIFGPLRPSGAKQEQLQLGRPVRLRSRGLPWRFLPLLLQFTASWTRVFDDTLQPSTLSQQLQAIQGICGL